ncbi:dTDP-4-dehydrorhamnose 3,5-epimerase family protein [Nonomuraea guangzhouensis]|uniref:dTDP-4-dehydrorhamnose 3,5-epimerase family protein n=1 Tax=Nonomuraea guangzhouensis TaxID=1291555 RepID=A0ABW4GJU7_9ACTN|nr:dTDP-4-dehydrorhamnose 3,5-epimerase family protein [Nonomuraea guangzhouensis]
MHIEELDIEGSFLIEQQIYPDLRGIFLEPFSQPAFRKAVGHPLWVAQVNCSASHRGTIRGLHVVRLPGQARYFNCAHGAMLCVVLDTRIGSPTFGEHVAVELTAESRRALYVAEGLAAGFLALTKEVTVWYLCSSLYAPSATVSINPLDRDLNVPWPREHEFILSEMDRTAPSLREAAEQGLLPLYRDCRTRYAELDAMADACP